MTSTTPNTSWEALCLESSKKQEEVVQLFAACTTPEERYAKLIALGRSLEAVPPEQRVPANEVPGCQSRMYLYSRSEGGRIYFRAESEALVSAGLAAVLILAYSRLSPEAILKCPPTYLEALQLHRSLTPNRSNGLYSIHLKMKQDALKLLLGRAG